MSESKAKILLVDDDVDFRLQQRLQLEAAGYEVVEAESREAAERMLQSASPDLAIVDLMLEEMDAGFVLSREIKQKYPNLPVIMVTAVASETGMEFEHDTPASRAWIKAEAVLAKPVRFEQLQAEIDRLLGRSVEH